MTRKADTLRPFLRCAAVVLCSLALPLVVFALWDRTLLAAINFTSALHDWQDTAPNSNQVIYLHHFTKGPLSQRKRTFCLLTSQYFQCP